MKKLRNFTTLLLSAIIIANLTGCWLDIFGGVGKDPRPTAVIYYENNGEPRSKPVRQNGTINVGSMQINDNERNLDIIIKNTGIETLTIDAENITITGAGESAFVKWTPVL